MTFFPVATASVVTIVVSVFRSSRRAGRYLQRLVIGLLAIGLPLSVQAQDVAAGSSLFDRFHYQASQRLSDFIGQIDEFFGGEEESARVNESWARVRLDTLYDEEEGGEFKGNIKLKVVLPNAERRFRLLLSTDEDDARDNAQGEQNAAQDSNSSLSLALRFIRRARDNAGLKFDLGVRSRDSRNQAFARIGAFFRYPLGENWTGTITNNAFYYHSSGFVDKLTFKFDRVFGQERKMVFQSSTLFGWSDRQQGATAEQVLGLYRAFGDSSSVALELLAGAVTSPEPEDKRFQGGTMRLRYRRSVWRPWFYVEFWPSVSWPVEYDYKGIYGGLFRIEALIGQQD